MMEGIKRKMSEITSQIAQTHSLECRAAKELKVDYYYW